MTGLCVQGVMKRLRNHFIGIDQGEAALFSDFEDNGPMWSKTGPRVCHVPVVFSAPFKALPTVHVSLSMWDIDTGTNARMDIKGEAVSLTGFDIVFRTWGDTRVARARASWMAFGELRDTDEWDLY